MIRRLLALLAPKVRTHDRARGPVVINPEVRERVHVWGKP